MASRSPILGALGSGAALLSPAFRLQFQVDRDAPAAVRLDGCMDRIWQRPRLLRPMSSLLGIFEIAVAETGAGVPTDVHIQRERNTEAWDALRWSRRFRLRRERRFASVVAFDSSTGELVEWLGRFALIGVVWRLRFVPPYTLLMDGDRYRLRVGRRPPEIPRFVTRALLPAVGFIERADPQRVDQFTIAAWATHSLLGGIFGYQGTFRVSAAGRPTRPHLERNGEV